MAGKQTYWISDPNSGAKAVVEGVEERNRWVQVQGWAEADEPQAGDLVWAHNPDTDGRTTLPHAALAEGGYWRGVGFTPSAPAEPVDLTKDPALRDQPKPTKTTPAKADEEPDGSADSDESAGGTRRGRTSKPSTE